ncbi:type II secretion system protein [Roseateles albus]|uniref:Type II secretion system protein n=1 Tax=Roseateles albus TaxID=2987525 RepID=A0ABT5KAP4_9BURK|nr:type II secretion system protein [Roseateles albus]
MFRSPTTRTKPHIRGFTLVEMLAVVTIVGILAAAAQPLSVWMNKRHKEGELRQGLRTLRLALDAYKQASVNGQIVVAADASGYPPNLNALVEGVPDAKDPKGRKIYFLRRLPRDPLADPGLPAARSWGLRSYDSPADAPQPGRDVFDVYSQASGIGLDGTRYRDW